MEVSKIVDLAVSNRSSKKVVALIKTLAHLIKFLYVDSSDGQPVLELKIEKKKRSKKGYSFSIALKINHLLWKILIQIVLLLLFRS